jgi:hypothetical protein
LNLLELTVPNAACPSLEDDLGVNLICAMLDKSHPNYAPEYNIGCDYPAGSLKSD